MSNYEDEDDELDETQAKTNTETTEATLVPNAEARLGESSEEDENLKKDAEAEAKGEYMYAEDYKEKADAAKIYNETKN